MKYLNLRSENNVFLDYRIYHLTSHKTKTSTKFKEILLGHYEDIQEATEQFNNIVRDFMRNKRHKVGDELVLKNKSKTIGSMKIDVMIYNPGVNINTNNIVIKNKRKGDLI
ncbi:MAG TPA: hypothetical protein PKL04_00725 [Methanofastidiosum sp.]|nr:hypothetical protein [Methanofastidiosum sp.]